MAKKTATAASKAAESASVAGDAPQSTKAKKVKIPCAIAVFFTYCRVAWGYCSDYRERMVKLSGRFTEEFINNQLAVVDEVELLPTINARRAAATDANKKMLAAMQAVRSLLKLLGTYIKYAYKNDKSLIPAQLKAAGLDIFSQNSNSENTTAMIRNAKQYLSNNLEKLVANNNMPAGFPAEFTTASANFSAALLDYIAKEKAKEDGTGNQEAGIERILGELQPMLDLGQDCFEFEPLERKKFTRTYLLNEVRSKHHAGLVGTTRLAPQEKPKPGVRVQVEGNAELFAISNEKGRYELNLPAGTYNIVFTSEATQPLTVIGKVVKPGVKGVLSALLEPKAMEVPAVTKSPVINEAPSTGESLTTAIGEVKVSGNGVAA